MKGNRRKKKEGLQLKTEDPNKYRLKILIAIFFQKFVSAHPHFDIRHMYNFKVHRHTNMLFDGTMKCLD